MPVIRFFALTPSLHKWRGLVKELLGKEGTEPQRLDMLNGTIERQFYDVELTEADRALLQEKLWYAESGTGETATKRPYRWNDCMQFHEMAGNCRCGKPATLKVRATGEQVCKLHKPDGFVADRLFSWEAVAGLPKKKKK